MDRLALNLRCSSVFCLSSSGLKGVLLVSFGFMVSAVQPDRPDDMQTFVGSPNLCSKALEGVAVSGWGRGVGLHLWRFLELPCEDEEA